MITSCPSSSAALSASPLSSFRTGPPDRSSSVVRPKRPVTRSFAAPSSDFIRYLPVGLDDGDYAARLLGVGRTHVEPGDAYPKNEHPKMYRLDWRSGRVLPELQMLLLTDARGEFESRETGCVPIHGHAVVLLFPGVWHRYRPDRAHGWTERWISLNSIAAQQLVAEGIVSPERPVLCCDDMAKAVAAFDLIAKHVQAHCDRHPRALAQAAMRIICLAAGGRSPATEHDAGASSRTLPPRGDGIVEKAREIIWNHRHLRSVCVSEVAKQLPVTRRTLDRRFAQTVGHSVLDEINACRMWRAKQLLKETDLLIKTVAFLAGFPSRERMRLLFLGEEGLTPSEYRERMAPARMASDD